MIQIKDLTKQYYIGGNRLDVLKGISLAIESGEMLALMGASGSGKSSLMNIIGLLDRPSGGSYQFDNREVASLSDDEQAFMRNRKIGFVFQAFYLLPRQSAIQNVCLPLTYRGESGKSTKDRALQMLTKVGMADYAHHMPSQLSGGQQQRVAIARALIGQPEIILADEPTGALDSKTSQDVMDLFKNLHQSEKTTLIIVTHDAKVGEQCEKIVYLKDGLIDSISSR